MLIDQVKEYYLNQNYNCAESVLRGANDYYQLGLCDHDMKMVAGLGAGVQTGDFCGALAASVCVLSMMYVKERAHEGTLITEITTELLEKAKAELTSTACAIIKPLQFQEGIRCLNTVTKACMILEETVNKNQHQRI